MLVLTGLLIALIGPTKPLPLSGMKMPSVKFLKIEKHKFQNTPELCIQNDSCHLKRFDMMKRDTQIFLNEFFELSYVSHRKAEYETDSVEHLEEFAIVQFMRGCRFDSRRLNDGRIEKSSRLKNMYFFEATRSHHFPEWVIDSRDKNPIFGSIDDQPSFKGRPHFGYRWNEKPGEYDVENEWRFGEKKPSIPLLYTRDTLTSSTYIQMSGIHEKMAMNNSLQFRTCIYKTKDIPQETTPDDINFAQPIACHEWSSSFVFNHNTLQFESPIKIDPFCLQNESTRIE